jgi:hypothetical protein
MKRPQFGLRLLLLIIALFASLFAVQRAHWAVEESDRQAEIDDLRVAIKVAERRGWDVRWQRSRLQKLAPELAAQSPTEVQVE